MEYVTVHDVDLPVIGLGTWQLRGRACRDAVAHALSIGYRHIDTARMYANEAEVGAGIRDSGVDRDEVFLATKVRGSDADHEGVPAEVESSLRELGVEQLDLLLLHQPGPHPLAETMDAFRAEQDAGRVRHLGLSNVDVRQAERGRADAPILTVQNEHHLHRPDEDMRRWCQDQGIALTAYSPLGKGSDLDDRGLAEVADRHGRTPAQIALRWLVEQDHVVAIPRSGDTAHREQNLDVFDFQLDDDDRARLRR